MGKGQKVNHYKITDADDDDDDDDDDDNDGNDKNNGNNKNNNEKKNIKKLNFNYPFARIIYNHVPVSVKQFTRFIK